MTPGETVTFGRLLDSTSDPAARLALLAESLEGQIATVFRQIAMNRFENLVHTAAGHGTRGGQDRQVVAGPAPRMEAARFQQRADAEAGLGEMPVGDASDQGLACGRPDQAERGPQRREELGDAVGMDVVVGVHHHHLVAPGPIERKVVAG